MKLACINTDTDAAVDAAHALEDRYEFVPVTEAEVIVALGGDGHLLHSLHAYQHLRVPIYGMNCGTVGFLMNEFREDDLEGRIKAAQKETLEPLRMEATRADGSTREAIAFNEVSLLRVRQQTAHLQVSVNGVVRIGELACDGILLATPAGSTAYNLSAHGPIIPLDANLLALTPISPFRPRRWQGALLSQSALVEITNLDPGKRPVSAAADFHEVSDVRSVRITQDRAHAVSLLFDPDRSLEERIFAEQFAFDESGTVNGPSQGG